MVVLFENYADPDGNPAREFLGVFDCAENIPDEYRREEWNDADNRTDWPNPSVIEPEIKRYGGKRFYYPEESIEADKMFKRLDWYQSFGFYSAHEIRINEINKQIK